MLDIAVRPAPHKLSVLHIGGSCADSRIVREALTGARGEAYGLEWVETLAQGLEKLAEHRFGAVILDRDLPGGLALVLRATPTIPVLVIGTERGEQIVRETIQAGAHDYLLTPHLDSYWLPRAVRDAVQIKQSEEALASQAERSELTLSSVGASLLSTDRSGRITYLNRVAEVMTGWTRGEAMGRQLTDALHVIDGATREELTTASCVPQAGETDAMPPCILVRRDGSESAIEHSTRHVHDNEGVETGAEVVLRDVSRSRSTLARVSHLATHDALTDLPNRILLIDRLGRALASAQRHQRRLAVLYVDIDHFKQINDSLGHTLGDEILQSVARELTRCVRSSDTVSRYGGDEFVVVLSELEHVEDAAKGARKLIAALGQAQTVSGHELRITASVGISVYPDDGRDANTLLTHADMALYAVKDRGRDGFQFFDGDLLARARERRAIEVSLQPALDNGQFALVYQPKIDLKTGTIAGAEALIRWRHPVRGVLGPMQFVAIAEDCGFIAAMGRWVVHEACQQAQRWQAAGLSPIPVAVNVSAAEFRNKTFVRDIVDTLSETGLDPQYLEIELTESVLMAHMDEVKSMLHALKDVGVQLAIDDFGTGWSSLSYLRHFPTSALKIDKSFVQEIVSESQASPIVTAVISMARSLHHRVIAEGVETRNQVAFLRSEGCDHGQGFYFSPPLAADQFTRLLEAPAHAAMSRTPLWRAAPVARR